MGQPPIDPKIGDPLSQTDAIRRIDNDLPLQDKLKNTYKLFEVKIEDFDAVFYPGGHGPFWLKILKKNGSVYSKMEDWGSLCNC